MTAIPGVCPLYANVVRCAREIEFRESFVCDPQMNFTFKIGFCRLTEIRPMGAMSAAVMAVREHILNRNLANQVINSLAQADRPVLVSGKKVNLRRSTLNQLQMLIAQQIVHDLTHDLDGQPDHQYRERLAERVEQLEELFHIHDPKHVTIVLS
jgi:hypothetical protein